MIANELIPSRGKKMYRKFAAEEQADEGKSENDADDAELEMDSPRLRPFTRSSIKPRLLFQTEKQRLDRLADEEAVTDIEEQPQNEASDRGVDTEEEAIKTPVKRLFEPATPPETTHKTRSASKKARTNGNSSPLVPDAVDAFEMEPDVPKKISPFDGWRRTKAGSESSGGKGKKREGEAIERDGKKLKGDV